MKLCVHLGECTNVTLKKNIKGLWTLFPFCEQYSSHDKMTFWVTVEKCDTHIVMENVQYYVEL